ncbi:GNAT family N-acetyltransferase [Natronoflexus pectinivorans]|uniref:Acetyltransferase (GNAT) family protein n=1 Tax=Natronoflexus pectinivorans TaxID=682526 RepID=A0A4R2G0K0_9BACT|nr:GNAT family N-acetyltransferase [Natronoflexus pectinivorans]TCO01020.1 acetyltransferase (GNAT) family protein [Natronoflexus pectinivorans]
MAVIIKFDDDSYFQAYIGNNEVGTLDILIDEDEFSGEISYWLNGIYVNKEFQRQGIATELIKKAIDEFEEVFVSSASQWEHKQNGDTSARELCDDGADLVNKLIERKIIKKEWMINPFGEDTSDY